MTLIEKAAEDLLRIITEDETVKNFPKEFVAESAKWIRSWFLKDDPVTTSIVENPVLLPSVKQPVLEAKLNVLKSNPTFVQELQALLKNFEQQKVKRKGIVENSQIDAQGNVHIGDKGLVAKEGYDEKNIVKASTIKAGGDFRLGDDVFSGNENVQIIHKYFSGKKVADAPASGMKAELQKLLSEGKTEEAIEVLLDTPGLGDDLRTQALLQSGRIHHLNRQIRDGIISDENARIERAQINAAVLALAKELD